MLSNELSAFDKANTEINLANSKDERYDKNDPNDNESFLSPSTHSVKVTVAILLAKLLETDTNHEDREVIEKLIYACTYKTHYGFENELEAFVSQFNSSYDTGIAVLLIYLINRCKQSLQSEK